MKDFKVKKWLLPHEVVFPRTLFCLEHTGLYTRSVDKFLREREVVMDGVIIAY